MIRALFDIVYAASRSARRDAPCFSACNPDPAQTGKVFMHGRHDITVLIVAMCMALPGNPDPTRTEKSFHARSSRAQSLPDLYRVRNRPGLSKQTKAFIDKSLAQVCALGTGDGRKDAC
jgi:hypothetical protein